MNKRKGFTLIELLVVIAIIALLMSILMPALTKVRQQAQSVIDKSNLHQFSLIWKLYTDDHDGFFPGRGSGTDCDQVNLSAWPNVISNFMPHTDPKMWLCPSATKRFDQGARQPWAAWNTDPSCEPLLVGSYSTSYWIANYEGSGAGASRDPDKFWRTPSVKGASYAPLMFDCAWKDIEPEPYDAAAPYNGYWGYPDSDEMWRVCINRHSFEINSSFLDLSVKAIRLKRVWKLKWHKKWVTDAFPDGGWPSWMLNLPE
jgi:prepilin-type N-terminal cleavage/methylation domain-containing protein